MKICSELSSKQPPLVHDKVVAYRRWSLMRKINKINAKLNWLTNYIDWDNTFLSKIRLIGKRLKAMAYFTLYFKSYHTTVETLYNVLYQITVPTLVWHLSNDFLTIIRDHVGWSLTGNRKLKIVSNFLPEEWSWSLKKLE